MTTIIRRLFVLGLVLLPALTGWSQVVFTVTGTATSTGSGYNLGETYTFVFTTGQTFADTPTSYYYSNRTLWSEETTGDGQLWAAIGGTGVTGSFTRPSAVNTDPYSMLRIYRFNTSSPFELLLRVDADTTTDIGLKTPGGQAISHVVASMSGGALPAFAFNLSYSQPTAYFSAYLGNYMPGTTLDMAVGLSGGGTVGFTATSVTIAVPEPSTYAAILTLGVLAYGSIRRLLGRR